MVMTSQRKAYSIGTMLLIAAMQMQVITSLGVNENAKGRESMQLTDTDFGFWTQKLPGTNIPGVLLKRKSGLSPEQLQRYSNIISNGSLALHSSELCDVANLLCNRSVNLGSLASSTFAYGALSTDTAENMFFASEQLREGALVTLPDLEDQTTEYAFLPRILAEKLPISSKSLPEIKRDFNISEGSNMSMTMDMVTQWCEVSHPSDQRGKCMTSIEDMVDYVVSEVGSNVELLTQPIVNSGGQENVSIVKVEPRLTLSSGYGIACHSLVFPYALYYCHQQRNTTAFKVWVNSSMDGKVTARPVFCHLDFAPPNSTGAACHFLYGSHISWVPK